MSVHKIPAIAGKFKEGKGQGRKQKASVVSRIQQMKARRATADEMSHKGSGKPTKLEG